jgi:hypothetical protein
MLSIRSTSSIGSVTRKLQGLSLNNKMFNSDSKKDYVKIDYFYRDKSMLRAYLV